MDAEIRNKILDLVHSRPMAIAEIADHITKNWRTANRYTEQLNAEDLIKIHVFRKGGRGALKIAYWPSSITENPSGIKNFLLQKILNSSRKEDFSALDVIQHIPEKKRKISYVSGELYNKKEYLEDFLNSLEKATSKILFFSGNLSLINISQGYDKILKILDKKLNQGVNVSILTRVDASNSSIIKDLLQLNKTGNPGKIEIRYAYQPLRCTLIDQKEARLKEKFLGHNYFESKNKPTGTYIYHTNDTNWVDWLSSVFWHMWRGSITAEKRLKVLKEIP